ncbi:serine hydrolase domain-containing protein [Maribellus maritimus]|uniref:serine hydrolase domain-containing protein n=1 Tax=Maribellus maritimus TaxID=2870838 RepID=UPI001EEB7199|nr:serine hydrolase domain-containing protein [Maribellus maritimus]MCG6186920.1 beta-lactamase family protein [Maribellus maritimus]
MKLLSVLLISNLLLFVHPEVFSQSLENRIDSILQEKYKSDAPGAVFLVAKDGVPVYRKAFGKANIELNVDLNPEAVFQIGSMTKQFTAVAILMLEEAGKLKVTDDITKFIPDYPTHGKKITIHHLLSHTSGIKDFTRMKSIMSIAKKDLTPKELVDFFKNEPMDFEPGEKFQYNNSGYVLLGYIIELVSGMTYEDFIQNNIFVKADMKDSRYASDREVITNRAYGYQQNGDILLNKMHISFNIPYASGSLMSTAEDLLKWQNAINNNLLVSGKTIELAFTNYTLNSGEKINYGYGWHLREIDGFSDREHGGSIFGFKSMAVYVPEMDIYVVGLTNCDCNSPTQVTRDIAVLATNYFLK